MGMSKRDEQLQAVSRLLRTALDGHSASSIAGAVNKNPSSVNRWVNGSSLPDSENYSAIEEALNLPPGILANVIHHPQRWLAFGEVDELAAAIEQYGLGRQTAAQAAAEIARSVATRTPTLASANTDDQATAAARMEELATREILSVAALTPTQRRLVFQLVQELIGES